MILVTVGITEQHYDDQGKVTIPFAALREHSIMLTNADTDPTVEVAHIALRLAHEAMKEWRRRHEKPTGA